MKIDIPESYQAEFKQEWSETARKTLIAFANCAGGVLYFGVADDGEVVGCDYDKVCRAVHEFTRAGVDPAMNGLVNIKKQTAGGKTVATVIVAPGTKRPYSLKSKVFSRDGVFIRNGAQTVSAKLEEVFDLIRRGDPRPWETRPCPRQDLEFEDAAKAFRENGIPFGKDYWLGYGLVDKDQNLTNLAQLLSDQNETVVRFNFYRPDGMLESAEEEHGSILRQMAVLRRRIDAVNVPVVNKKTKTQSREEIYPWPVVAVREALTNCMAHRDYESPVQASAEFFRDKIVFFTDGGIPPEISSLEKAVRSGVSYCRNPHLAEIFQKFGWMEKVGSGFGDIIRSYTPYRVKPRFESFERSLFIYLPRIVAPDSSKETVLLGFLAEFPEGRGRAQIQQALGVSRPTLMKLLNKLEEDGRISRCGQNRSTVYRLRPAGGG